MVDDVVINKVASIERAIARAREEYASAGPEFGRNLTKLDAATLNVQRACETAIDLAQHVVRKQNLGNPGSARELFVLLAERGFISDSLSVALSRMVGFRNIAVHEYQKLNPLIVISVIERNLDDILSFAQQMLQTCSHPKR